MDKFSIFYRPLKTMKMDKICKKLLTIFLKRTIFHLSSNAFFFIV